VEDDRSVDQPRFLGAKFLRIQAMPAEESRTLVGEEDIGTLEQSLDLSTIFLGVSEDRLTHADLHFPGESVHLRVTRPPDVQDVRPVQGKVPAHRTARDDVAHAEGTDALQRKIAAWLERHRLTVADLLHRDQRHLRE